MKDGTEIQIENLHDLVWLANSDVWKYCKINGDIITVEKNDILVKLKGWRYNGDINGVFVMESYRSLSVKDALVIDVGANIGDSSIYFALHGAKKVIALEPVPANYEVARKNIELNKIQNVELVLAGCSGKRTSTKLDPNKISNGPITESEMGVDVKMLTLNDLVSDYHIESGVLKMDCEGCEYDVIMSSDTNTLRKFNHIFCEVHSKFDKMNQMKNKLETAGFNVQFVNTNWKTHLPEFIEAMRR